MSFGWTSNGLRKTVRPGVLSTSTLIRRTSRLKRLAKWIVKLKSQTVEWQWLSTLTSSKLSPSISMRMGWNWLRIKPLAIIQIFLSWLPETRFTRDNAGLDSQFGLTCSMKMLRSSGASVFLMKISLGQITCTRFGMIWTSQVFLTPRQRLFRLTPYTSKRMGAALNIVTFTMLTAHYITAVHGGAY